jgi:hypothetical protein
LYLLSYLILLFQHVESNGCWAAFGLSGRFAILLIPPHNQFKATKQQHLKEQIVLQYLRKENMKHGDSSESTISSILGSPFLCDISDRFIIVLGDRRCVKYYEHTVHSGAVTIPSGVSVIGTSITTANPSSIRQVETIKARFANVVSPWWSNVRRH